MKIRRSKNQIEQIQVNGQEIKGVEEIKNAAHKHFKELLSTSDQQAANGEILQHIKKKISDQQNRELDKEITEEKSEELCGISTLIRHQVQMDLQLPFIDNIGKSSKKI